MMRAVLLDEKQTSVVAQSCEPVEVHDPDGALMGHIMPKNAPHRQFDMDRWVECFDEWYFETDEQEPEKPETD